MYKQFWKVAAEDGTEVEIIFVKKKDAVTWISQQSNKATYHVVKYGM